MISVWIGKSSVGGRDEEMPPDFFHGGQDFLIIHIIERLESVDHSFARFIPSFTVFEVRALKRYARNNRKRANEE